MGTGIRFEQDSVSPKSRIQAERLILGFLFFFSLLLFLTNCAGHIVSAQMRLEANPALTFGEVQADPDRYLGNIVIWGGVIIETENRQEATYIKMLQTPLRRGEVPMNAEASLGRFLIKSPRYLDPEIYSKGRKLTVAGEIIGKEVLPIGEISYTYPLLLAKELHLIEEIPSPVIYYPPPYWYYWRWYH